ncbi:C1 family peptidase [Luteipulveratus mongoliensis]|uniref:Peptidase n=1 Tax=Luteipulveratus mongoliensis TaxID=571913 RepID=A0A0K1JFQ1_9MICO|nr:C1 family peptidase [Luteipulveratus mongoliensis]AKU15420.1 peptidase [Luteipulveratus mongoliensis]
MRSSRLLAGVTLVGAALTVMSSPGVAQAAVKADSNSASSSAASSHGMGLNLDQVRANKSRVTTSGHALPVRKSQATLPASFDLSQYALAPGDQGQVGSCVAWATGYTGIGLLMKEQGINGTPMAPMFVYAQIAKGNDQGTYAGVALPIEKDQGIDTKADYWQGDFDYTTQPDAAERANAAHYKLSGFTDLTASGDLKTNIMTAISQGQPVPFGFSARNSFRSLSTTNYNYNPTKHDRIIGGHEVTIVGYDSTGVKIQNSWGSEWGNHGFFTAPWSFITGRDVDEVHAMGKLVTS